MSLEDPIKRSREIETQVVASPARKRSKKMTLNNDTAASTTAMTNDDEFTEKMYSAYVKSAFASLEKVCYERKGHICPSSLFLILTLLFFLG